METIRPIEPEGLKQKPITNDELQNVKLEKVRITDEPKSVTPPVHWFDLLRLWVRENLINDILSSQKGLTMQTKSWLYSKTIIGNLLLLIWSFVGPMIGIPVLSPELMFTLTLAYNLILRFLTKKPVVIVEEVGGSKPWYYSKTVWTNVISGVWVFIGPLIGVPVLSPDLMAQILDVLNIVLRFVTKQPLKIG
ncbi:MAG: hypothetical protein AB1728_13270 [Bacteroidota bacterium]